MKRLNKFLSKIGMDKALHFAVAGWAVSAVSPFGIGAMGITFLVIYLLSIMKERYLDEYSDYNDVIAGFLGGIASILLYIPIDLIIN